MDAKKDETNLETCTAASTCFKIQKNVPPTGTTTVEHKSKVNTIYPNTNIYVLSLSTIIVWHSELVR